MVVGVRGEGDGWAGCSTESEQRKGGKKSKDTGLGGAARPGGKGPWNKKRGGDMCASKASGSLPLWE